MDTLQSICEMVLADLSGKYPHTVYTLWFESLKLYSLTDVEAVFSINNDFKRQTLETHYTEALEESILAVMGFPVSVRFISSDIEDPLKERRQKLSEEEKRAEEERRREDDEKRERLESSTIVEDYSFDNFIVGESNKFAYAACFAIAYAKDAPIDYNPLFLYGPSGLGKTHLLFAITNVLKKEQPGIRIVYKKGEEFINEMVDALKEGTMGRFRERYRFTDVLLIDDIQFIAGKVQIQEEFFHTFCALYESGKQIIMTSDRPPKEIKPLEDRLLSRFEWGVLADIQPPSEELRTAIIRSKAENLHITIPEDAIEFLSNSLHKNIRQIEGAIKKISAVSSITSTPITLDMCRRAIADIVSGVEPASVTVDKILKVVSANYGVSVDDIKGQKRDANIASARHMAIFLLRHNTDLSLADIGKVFSRNHSTTISSVKKMEEEKKSDPYVSSLINELTKKIKEEG